jgi:Domain of unknown function (DUF4082)/Bacterial Ig domain
MRCTPSFAAKGTTIMVTPPPIQSFRRRFSTFWLILAICLGCALRAYSQCSTPANPIVAENCLRGNPASEWDVGQNSAGDLSIQGFATDISVNQGGTIAFKINTNAKAYTITIYRIGYYRGMGARKIAAVTPSVPLPQIQPACKADITAGLIDCGNWAVTATWQVPTTATSGVYIAHLKRTDNGGDSHIVFIVRNDSSHSDILYQTSDETWQAYNYYGAGSFYGPASPTYDLSRRSYKVSYNRPFLTRGFSIESDSWLFGPEFPMIQWLEQNGYDVTYFTGVDAARNGSLITNHKVYMDSGHDEYWSAAHRASVQAARDAGVNLAFFTGNEVFWKTRWENSIDGTSTPYRTLVCYKETLAFAKIDPSDPPIWTGTWRDAGFSPPADGGKPENSLTGTLFMVNGTSSDNHGDMQIEVPSADGKMRFWRNTAAASLNSGSTYTMPKGTLGYEWDEDLDNGSRPPGLFDLSTSTHTLTSDLLLDQGATYGAGTATHRMTMYRAPSGALVFSSGTIDWSWGLNSDHDNPFSFTTPNPDPNMQQATVNLFADMGVQPATLQRGLQVAAKSTDTAPPISTITSPASGATVNGGATVTVTGTATDSGGAVGGVEVSGDGGTTWHPATGRENWSCEWTPRASGQTTLLSRAVDDSGNLEQAHGIPITIPSHTCPCRLWNSSNVHGTPDSGDAKPVEVGLKFRVDADGTVLAVRFYKAPANTGAHVGHLWSSSGTLLGTANFTNETSSGWQQAKFSQPVPISANTTYVVSYFAPQGHYSADSNAFAQSGIDDPPLYALANGVDGSNGVYSYTTSAETFPIDSFLSTNYWVDVVYSSSNTLHGLSNGNHTAKPWRSGTSSVSTSTLATTNTAAVSRGNVMATVTKPLSISGTIKAGGGAIASLTGAATATTTADSSGNYAFNDLLAGAYVLTPTKSGVLFTPGTQSVKLADSNATQVNFQAQVCNCISIWQPSTAPSLADANDGKPVEVGLKFRSDTKGSVTGIRFYKAAQNTGTHIGHLWDSSGTMLASVTFSEETASGWQEATFSPPIAITANTDYVISYFAPVGHYSADAGYFASQGVDHVPLRALSNNTGGGNGIYRYTGAPGGFPTETYSSSNYWVDVVFASASP